MKLRYVSPRNIRHLIPKWAIDPFSLAKTIDQQLGEYWEGRPPSAWNCDTSLRFWFEVVLDDGMWLVRLAELEEGQEPHVIYNNAGQVVIETPDWRISFPLNDVLKGSPSLEGTHSVYIHQFPSGEVSQYVGLTKQKWFVRLAQHQQQARSGSQFLFHRALRDHPDERMIHRIFFVGMTYEEAMHAEEELVEICGLYPRGLNMIPGGFAGLAYLATLGFKARSAHDRDRILVDLSKRESLAGKPNPLCAARWAADQDYVNNVICGHSGRLSVDQVRNIRMLSASGKEPEKIAGVVGDRVDRVLNVLKGNRYARVA